MSGLTGKNTLSFKKETIKESLLNNVGFQDLVFAHEATAGETSIDFTSLTLPSEMSTNGFVNPTSTEILNANLALFRNNVSVVSSVNGVLMNYITFVANRTNIQFLNDYSTLAGEILTISLNNNASTGNSVVTGSTLVKTGSLLVGQQDINTGEAFPLNKYSTEQIGAVAVYLNGIQVFRNVGNATADPAADGNYEEVNSGSGVSTLIRLNEPVTSETPYTVISTNLIAERPSISQQQYLESLQGQVDRIIPTVASLAGVDETDFQAAPNNVDLKAFGDRLLEIETRIQAKKFTNADSPVAVDANHDVYLCDCASGAITVNLPLAADSKKRRLDIKKIDSSANVVTIDGSGAETIDGALTIELDVQYESVTLITDGLAWWRI